MLSTASKTLCSTHNDLLAAMQPEYSSSSQSRSPKLKKVSQPSIDYTTSKGILNDYDLSTLFRQSRSEGVAHSHLASKCHGASEVECFPWRWDGSVGKVSCDDVTFRLFCLPILQIELQFRQSVSVSQINNIKFRY